MDNNMTSTTRPFNFSRWALEAGYINWYNQFNVWTNPEVAGLVPLIADRPEIYYYVWHLAGLA